MATVQKDDRIYVGVAAFDQEHGEMNDLIVGLHAAMLAGAGPDVLAASLDRLVSLTMRHFREEEWLFAKTGYPEAAEHTREHEDLTKQIIAVQAKFKGGAHGMLTLDFMKYLRNWLCHHIGTSDRAYGPHLNAHGFN
jgi:hemerythrin-like metal-binding protein